MDCLITGITGFLGPHLARLLIKNGHNVYGILRGTRGSEQEIKDLLTEEEFCKITFFMEIWFIIEQLINCVKNRNLMLSFI